VTTATAEVAIERSAQTLKLTDGLDSLTGGFGDDKIGGVLSGSGATGTTVAPGDSIEGGAGTDTLTISVAGAITTNTAYTLSAVQTTDVEKVLISNFDTATGGSTEELNIIDASLMNGVETSVSLHQARQVTPHSQALRT